MSILAMNQTTKAATSAPVKDGKQLDQWSASACVHLNDGSSEPITRPGPSQVLVASQA